jgi:hypothetical protein
MSKLDKEETVIRPSMIKYNIAIVGSRTFDNYDLFKYHVNELLHKITDGLTPKFENYRIVSGGAKGVDSMARQYANEHKIELLEFLPDWRKNGKVAGLLRNTDIINNADWVIAFLQNNSNGTRDSINKAKKANKKLDVIYIK